VELAEARVKSGAAFEGHVLQAFQAKSQDEESKSNEEVMLQMEVTSGALREGVCFLNSEQDFKDAKNFTLFIDKEALARFKWANFTCVGQSKSLPPTSATFRSDPPTGAVS
jgi:hypothetical protein